MSPVFVGQEKNINIAVGLYKKTKSNKPKINEISPDTTKFFLFRKILIMFEREKLFQYR